ncbi:MAG: DUF1549 domain-containing protein [Planctomycetota bacterium]
MPAIPPSSSVPPALPVSVVWPSLQVASRILLLLTFVVAPCFADDPTVAPPSAATPERWNFENHIIPVLTRYGCNMSGCHGKAEGQNGFRLSVFGFDPEADYQAIVQEGFGRRVFPGVPENSLLLLKATGHVPHGGGVRLDPARPEYARLKDWIAAGMPFGSPDDPQVQRIEVQPAEGLLTFNQQQPLRVTALWSDGKREDVTALATWQTNSEVLAQVDEHGLVTAAETPGTVAVMASYLGHVDLFQGLIPQPQPLTPAEQQHLRLTSASANLIDRLVAVRLQQLNLPAAAPCNDAVFHRRVFLDLIGTLPTSAESRTFLADTQPDRRERLVDRLLQRPEFNDYWALKWADLLRVNRRTLGRKAARAYHEWIRSSFEHNLPLDQFASRLLTASGPLADNPAGWFYKASANSHELTNTISQVFLGVRIECARCHHHPWDRWGQTDYHGLQALVTQATFKPIPGGESLTAAASGRTTHPRTGHEIFAHALDQPMPAEQPPGDRRLLLAAWLTTPDNPWFAQNLANRTWAHFLGKGLVEPVDDLRLTNPPSNPALLKTLAAQLSESGFDFRHFVRGIVLSETYQRSTTPAPAATADNQNYSRFPLKQLDAEVLLDAVSSVTGVPEHFSGMPAGSKAIQLWDSHLEHPFLTLFGRPVRETACECERVTEPSVGQVLHVQNSPEIDARLRHANGRLAALCEALPDNLQLIQELYLTCFGRLPDSSEQAAALQHMANAPSRREAVEDLTWSMLNSVEFLFNH